jgi:uncharacterized protein (TIGR00299 family) protein
VVHRGGLRATHVRVDAEPSSSPRSLSEVLDIIRQSGLPSAIQQQAERIFRRLAQAEAKVHGIGIESVHFHEVGAIDAIVDVAGACLGLSLLGIERVAASRLNLGGGRAETAHGSLPVPAPAALELLQGLPVYSTGDVGELVTPTGAAILATLCSHFGPLPAMKLSQVGQGAGSREMAGLPNVLRLLLGEAPELSVESPVRVIEANVDDMSPQVYAYFAEQALTAGALDVFTIPAQMKKNRPGQLIQVMARPEDASRLCDLLFSQTTTIGVRIYEAQRQTLEREWVSVETRWGAVRMKLARRNGLLLNAAPEYEDCEKIAREQGVPIKEILAEANHVFRSGFKD